MFSTMVGAGNWTHWAFSFLAICKVTARAEISSVTCPNPAGEIDHAPRLQLVTGKVVYQMSNGAPPGYAQGRFRLDARQKTCPGLPDRQPDGADIRPVGRRHDNCQLDGESAVPSCRASFSCSIFESWKWT